MEFDTKTVETSEEYATVDIRGEEMRLSEAASLLDGEREDERFFSLAMLTGAADYDVSDIRQYGDELREVALDENRSDAERALAGYVLGKAGMHPGEAEDLY